jgi:transcriptional regulator with XRE-family HTH domain
MCLYMLESTQPSSPSPTAARQMALRRSIGERIQRIRGERRITQRDLAARLGISQSRLSKYETGVHEVPLGTLVRLARFLMVSTDYVLTGGCGFGPLSSDPQLLDRFQQVAQMGPAERETWMGLLDGFLALFKLLQTRAQATARPSIALDLDQRAVGPRVEPPRRGDQEARRAAGWSPPCPE